jgi:hypothetical protein
MKVLLLTENNGESYEDYYWWVESVVLVPDDFSLEKEREAFIDYVKEQKLVRFGGNMIHTKDIDKFDRLFKAHLRDEFKQTLQFEKT